MFTNAAVEDFKRGVVKNLPIFRFVRLSNFPEKTLTFDFDEKTVSFSTECLELIGNPERVLILFGEEEKKIVLEALHEEKPDGIEIIKSESGPYTIKDCPKLVNILAEKMRWKQEGKISFSGKWAREGMIAFDLENTATAV